MAVSSATTSLGAAGKSIRVASRRLATSFSRKVRASFSIVRKRAIASATQNAGTATRRSRGERLQQARSLRLLVKDAGHDPVCLRVEDQ